MLERAQIQASVLNKRRQSHDAFTDNNKRETFFSISLHLNVVLVDMEISSTKHKCEWRTQNDIVIASSCRHPNDKTTAYSFTMAREQSCALSHKTTKAKTSTLQNPAPTPSSPWWIPPTWYKLQLFLGKLKMQMQPRSSSRSPSATPALPGSTDTWQQHRSLICLGNEHCPQ